MANEEKKDGPKEMTSKIQQPEPPKPGPVTLREQVEVTILDGNPYYPNQAGQKMMVPPHRAAKMKLNKWAK